MCTIDCFGGIFLEKPEPTVTDTIETLEAAGYEVTAEEWEEE